MKSNFNPTIDKKMVKTGRIIYPALSQMNPQGWMLEFFERQKSGLSGNFSVQGYPFNTVMWAGKISDIHITGLEYNAPCLPIPPGDAWWPYEQCAYLLDGIVRLGILLENKDLIAVFEKNLQYLINHPDERGCLGTSAYELKSQWPMAVMFRAVWVYYESRGCRDVAILEAFCHHFRALSANEIAEGFRHITNIEGLLHCYWASDDISLLTKAEAAYQIHNELLEAQDDCVNELSFQSIKENRRQSLHGVTYAEEIKLPVMLYLATGKHEYLVAAEANLSKVMADHQQPGGMLSATEYLSGRDPDQGYELCVMADLLWSLGYFFAATGKVEYLDWSEKIVFNAFMGAISKDFSAFEYLSSVNQVVATRFSNSTHAFRNQSAWRQFRVNHFPQCCGGQVHRVMPLLAGRLWGLDEDGFPVALCYGPADFTFEYRGQKIMLHEQTNYPFEDKITLVWELEKSQKIPLRLRIPRWCDGYTVYLNGEAQQIVADDNWLTIQKLWCNGDQVELILSIVVEIHQERNWLWLERGALLFSHQVHCHRENDLSMKNGVNFDLVDPKKWNFGLPHDLQPEDIQIELLHNNTYPWDDPPMRLKVKADRLGGGYEVLEKGRYTPAIPLFVHQMIDSGNELTLIPCGATLTRISAFPITGIKRISLPQVVAVAKGPYPYNPKMPIEIQKFEPEFRGNEDFVQIYGENHRVQANMDGYYDLMKHFLAAERVLGYLQIKFWSERNGVVTIVAGLADGGIGYLNGKELFSIEPICESESAAGYWFPAEVHQGYNYLLLKIVDCVTPAQYFKAWGAKIDIFHEESVLKNLKKNSSKFSCGFSREGGCVID